MIRLRLSRSVPVTRVTALLGLLPALLLACGTTANPDVFEGAPDGSADGRSSANGPGNVYVPDHTIGITCQSSGIV